MWEQIHSFPKLSQPSLPNILFSPISCSNCSHIDVTTTITKVTFIYSLSSTSHSIWYDSIFLSLTTTPIHQQVLSPLLQNIYICSEHVCLCCYHPGRSHQHLLPRVSDSLPIDLPASNAFSTQQPDGTSSRQPPYHGHKSLLTMPALLWSSLITPLFMPLQSSWSQKVSPKFQAQSCYSVCICCSPTWNTLPPEGYLLATRFSGQMPPPESIPLTTQTYMPTHLYSLSRLLPASFLHNTYCSLKLPCSFIYLFSVPSSSKV